MTPDLNILLDLIENLPSYEELRKDLTIGKNPTVSVLAAAKPYLIASVSRTWPGPVLLISARTEDCKRICDQTLAWSGERARRFPETDTLPYERISSDPLTELERVQVLSVLSPGCQPAGSPLIVSTAHALMGKTPSVSDFATTCHAIRVGTETDPLDLLRRWERMGYHIESVVEVPGTASHRGGIVDVFPPTSDYPARIEFFGNSVESIRLFDPVSQRSVSQVDSLFVGPATELIAPLIRDASKLEETLSSLDLSYLDPGIRVEVKQELDAFRERQSPANNEFYVPLFNAGSILDYLPDTALVILDESSRVRQAIKDMDAEAQGIRAEKIERGQLPANYPRPYFVWEEIDKRLGKNQILSLSSWSDAPGSRRLEFHSTPPFAGRLAVFTDHLKKLCRDRKTIIIISQQAVRLSELLAEQEIIAVPVPELKELPLEGSLTLSQGSLAEGWVMGEVHLFTDAEIFGLVKEQRVIKKRPVARHKLFAEFSPGDYVVHIEHGIARFSGLATMPAEGGEREYLVLQYAGGDKLYVPGDQIDRIDRYIGADDRAPVLSRLNTQEWVSTRKRAEDAAGELAQELLFLYAAREVTPGHAFSRDSVWQQELEASFPYVETADQLEAVRAVKTDMEKPKPMDRLVSGDVGYGKTEVAVRAAFKAVMDGKQVAVLVPTTVLAEQHFDTFTERMKAFPVRIESLSRFKTQREQHEIVKGLAEGTIDICVGTHRLIQKDIVFKDLGLLIIDEEQRFGVAHKEYLKKKRQEVDVLTLSATPIPRTLHMSLTGVRDISTMETPPEDRLPIKTFVAEYDSHLVREAVLREMERGGQVFFVHNRVQSIGYVTQELQKLVPEARFVVGHGQMPEDHLEDVMTRFARHESDVLVCTTIIESGLDMPSVNTVIINQADKLGLTQLYQLRGRVGRGTNLAYAYLMYDRGKRLTPTAERRMQTIYEATELGAGFNIALKDLEIRGAGNLLGTRQSGHISAVGFSLYTRLLAEAVEEQKARIAGQPPRPRKLPAPNIDLPFDAHIPESYVPDLNTRLDLYRDLAKIEKPEQIEDFTQALRDRFGEPPEEVRNLLFSMRIKLLAARAGVESVHGEDGQVAIRLIEGLLLDTKKLEPLRERVRFGGNRVFISTARLEGQWPVILEEALVRMS